MDPNVRLAAGCQGSYRHARAQIGAADADIDDVGNAFSRVPTPLPAVNFFAKIGHAAQRGLDLVGCVGAGAQGGVQNSAVFGVIDFFAVAHARGPAGNVDLSAQVMKQGEGLSCHALLRKIE